MDVEIPEGTTILTMENSGGSNSVWANAQVICDRAVMDRLKTLSVQPEEPAVAVGDSTNLVISAYSNGQESIALTRNSARIRAAIRKLQRSIRIQVSSPA